MEAKKRNINTKENSEVLKDKLEAAEKKLEEAFRSSDLNIKQRDSEGSQEVSANCSTKPSVPDFANLARLVESRFHYC